MQNMQEYEWCVSFLQVLLSLSVRLSSIIKIKKVSKAARKRSNSVTSQLFSLQFHI